MFHHYTQTHKNNVTSTQPLDTHKQNQTIIHYSLNNASYYSYMTWTMVLYKLYYLLTYLLIYLLI